MVVVDDSVIQNMLYSSNDTFTSGEGSINCILKVLGQPQFTGRTTLVLHSKRIDFPLVFDRLFMQFGNLLSTKKTLDKNVSVTIELYQFTFCKDHRTLQCSVFILKK
jgi:hypothetical protein